MGQINIIEITRLKNCYMKRKFRERIVEKYTNTLKVEVGDSETHYHTICEIFVIIPHYTRNLIAYLNILEDNFLPELHRV